MLVEIIVISSLSSIILIITVVGIKKCFINRNIEVNQVNNEILKQSLNALNRCGCYYFINKSNNNLYCTLNVCEECQNNKTKIISYEI
jgi:hypothetical protein